MYSAVAIVSFLVFAAPIAVLAGGGCDAVFGSDAPAIIKVQSSWDPAEKAMAASHYARALQELLATMPGLRQIRNTFMRRCVASGADMRVAAARAGLSYMRTHPGDSTGARKAAQRAWTDFPSPHNCP